MSTPRARPPERWPAALEAWHRYIRVGWPSTTVDLRMYHLRRVALEVGRTPATVTFDQLADWIGEQGWSPNTRKSVRSSLRSFYGWAMATGRVTESPAHLLPPVRVPRALPRPAPEVAYRASLERAVDERVRLAILLAGNCGLRRGEVARARTEHLEPDLLGRGLWVVGKGGHQRFVPVPHDTAEVIAALEPGWLFPNAHTGGPCTPHHVSKLVTATLPGDLTMHNLRHRCGTIAYRQTKDLRAVQELLGHARPETTALYTFVGPDEVRRAMESAA